MQPELVATAVGRRTIDVEYYRPEGDGPWPGVLLLHELFGLTSQVRADARLQIVWVGHALIGELARELHRDEPRAPSELGVLGFKREVVRFLEAALASSYRGA